MSAQEMSLPRCAVVLCTYNGERFLPEQLESLRRQTVQPVLYVLSDDASTDGSWALLQAFADERRRAGCEVILHRNENNLGYVRNFEQALLRADADVLFPCDQDDLWYPSKIERMLEVFATRDQLLVLHGDARLVDAEGKPLGQRLLEVLEVTRNEMAAMHQGRAFDVLLRRNIVTGAVMAMRRSLLSTALPVGEGWSHDEWLAMLAAMQGEVDTLEEVLIDYRQHGGNQIGVRQKLGLQQIGIGNGRDEFMRRAYKRWQELEARVVNIAELKAHVSDVQERRRHAQARAKFRDEMMFVRFRHVWSEWLSGRYSRFGHGMRSAAADLLGID